MDQQQTKHDLRIPFTIIQKLKVPRNKANIDVQDFYQDIKRKTGEMNKIHQ